MTGKFYVGMHSTRNLDDGYLGSGWLLKASIQKYGEQAHTKEILAYFTSREELVARETEIVCEELIADSMCLNLRVGGTGGFTPEQQRLNAIKSNANQMRRRQIDPEWVETVRAKKSESQKQSYSNGRPVVGCAAPELRAEMILRASSPESIDRRKKTYAEVQHQQGAKNSQYGTCWVTKDGVPRKVPKDELDTYLALGYTRGRK